MTQGLSPAGRVGPACTRCPGWARPREQGPTLLPSRPPGLRAVPSAPPALLRRLFPAPGRIPPSWELATPAVPLPVCVGEHSCSGGRLPRRIWKAPTRTPAPRPSPRGGPSTPVSPGPCVPRPRAPTGGVQGQEAQGQPGMVSASREHGRGRPRPPGSDPCLCGTVTVTGPAPLLPGTHPCPGCVNVTV